MIIMAEQGYKEGNQLVKEILEMGVVSKYRMAKDLEVSDTQIYNWLKGYSSPNEKNYLKLMDYRLYCQKLRARPQFRLK